MCGRGCERVGGGTYSLVPPQTADHDNSSGTWQILQGSPVHNMTEGGGGGKRREIVEAVETRLLATPFPP